MGDNLVSNGLSMVCKVLCLRSIYPRSQCMNLMSQMPPDQVRAGSVDVLDAEFLAGQHRRDVDLLAADQRREVGLLASLAFDRRFDRVDLAFGNGELAFLVTAKCARHGNADQEYADRVARRGLVLLL